MGLLGPVRNSIPGSAPASVPGAPHTVPGSPAYLPGGPTRNFPNFLTTVTDQPSSGQFRDIHTKQIRDFSGRFAGPWGIAWQGLDIVSENMTRMVNKTVDNTQQGMEQLGKEMEAYARQNAPWQDRSTDARKGLKSHVIHTPTRSTVFLGHSVDYGIWLEVRYSGRFAILLPTLRVFQPKVAGQLAVGI